MEINSTRDLILDSAQALAQSRGVNAFSYADIAVELGVKKASIHYHFPSKQDLEIELLERYRSTFMEELRRISSSGSGNVAKLEHYAQMYANTLCNDRICLGGMMASDVGTLPEQLVPSLVNFFEEQVEWLVKVMDAGKKAGELNFSGTAEAQATVFLASLQGGLLMANAMGNEEVFEQLRKTVIADLM